MADGSTTSYSFTLPEIGASEDTWGTKLNANWSLCDDLLDGTSAIAPNLTEGSWKVGGTTITATGAEINYIDGVTSAIQTQLDGKQASGTYLSQGGSITSGTVTTLTSTTANITTVDLGNWTITESAGVLYFASSGTNKMKLDASGNLTVTGNVTAYGTV